MASLIVSNVLNYQALLESVFNAFLNRKKVSDKTRKNYLSDIRGFISWVFSQNQSLLNSLQQSKANQEQVAKTILSAVSSDQIEEYKKTLFNAHTPPATINRHLSAIRMFFRCATETKWTQINPTQQTKNISSITNLLTNESVLSAFEKSLLADGASKTTVKNYLTDVSEFLQWVDQQPTPEP